MAQWPLPMMRVIKIGSPQWRDCVTPRTLADTRDRQHAGQISASASGETEREIGQLSIYILRDELVHRSEFEDVLGRVRYIEKKLGIESGV
jgi:hypothetical protein